MKLLLGCVATIAVASLGACAGSESKPTSLAGKWVGTATCYSMESPLEVTIDAATPTKASVSIGDLGVMTWDASVTVDDAKHTVAIAAESGVGDAALLAGTLEGDVLSGEMDKQLCNKFTLKRQP